MEILDELSNDSTISYLSNNPNDSLFIFENEEFPYTQKVEELEPQINNIVSSVNLGSNLNLKIIALKIKNAEYNSNKSSRLILKSKDNNLTGTIFSSGKMICSGAKSEKELKSACIKFAKIVNKAGFNVELKNFKIQNIIASYDVKFKISLPKLYNEINTLINNAKKFGNENNYCKFNTELIPCIIFYMNNSRISMSIFESGKVVFSGVKKRKEFEDIFKNIYPLLIEAKMVNIGNE